MKREVEGERLKAKGERLKKPAEVKTINKKNKTNNNEKSKTKKTSCFTRSSVW